ncbi:hypothetical protein [Lysobacter gummosus]
MSLDIAFSPVMRRGIRTRRCPNGLSRMKPAPWLRCLTATVSGP